MKKILSLIISLFLITTFAFAEDSNASGGDEYEDHYVYEINGAGDQFLKVNLGGLFPLNFKGQLYPGGAAEIGYYRLLTSNLGVGAEFGASYNVSIGEKMLVLIPITAGVLFQPTIGKFEIPVTVSLGAAYETFQNMNYFPSLTAKVNAGVYYRLNDVCSLGISSTALWIPQWSSKGFDQGLFTTVALSARYHF